MLWIYTTLLWQRRHLHFHITNFKKIKGEIQSRFKFIKKESKTFWTERWKFDLNRIKNKEDMKFWIFVFFNEILFSWTVDIWIREWVHELMSRFLFIDGRYFLYFCIYFANGDERISKEMAITWIITRIMKIINSAIELIPW